MNASTLLFELRATGLHLSRDGETLFVEPARLLTSAFRGEIRAHKAELLDLLAPSVCLTDATGAESEMRHLARAILDARRNDGRGPGFDFAKVRPFWHAANELTGRVMDSPELASWAREVLENTR